MKAEFKFDLLKNSISFFEEAVRYLDRRDSTPDRWKFAVINLVQAMELALKEALRRIHPAFIFADIDNPKSEKTVSITLAISRLRDPRIGKFHLTDEDVRQFQRTIQLRNQLVHQECTYHPEFAAAKFSSIFAFMLFFFEDHLGVTRNSIITNEQYGRILELKQAKDELLRRARDYIEENQITGVWLCPECSEETYIVEDGRCKLCGCDEPVVDCPRCGNSLFQAELVDVTNLFDVDVCEGRAEIMNRYGYMHDEYCVDCAKEISADIESQRFAAYCEHQEMEMYSFGGSPFPD